MADACTGGLSNYERKKQALISLNIWKSNFISIWNKYGSFQDIEGVRCFDLYRIDGDGEGQHRMSKHLKQPDMWEKTQHKDLKSVSLYFNLSKLITIDSEVIESWKQHIKDQLDVTLFDVLRYEIVDGDVVSHGFYKDNNLVEDSFYYDLSSYVAEKKLFEMNFEGNFTYDMGVSLDDVHSFIDDVVSMTSDNGGNSFMAVDEVEDAVQGYAIKEGIGVDILDDLVQKDSISVVAGFGGTQYYLPEEAARKMNPYAFVELLTKTLDFKVKKKGGFWRALKRFAKVILSAIAAYFQQYWLASSLLVGFIADETGIKALKVVSQILGFMQGDLTSFADMGTSEALSLLMNVYSLYVSLKYTPETGKEAVEDTARTQDMFYRAPHDAYSEIYCYKDLISVSLGDALQ